MTREEGLGLTRVWEGAAHRGYKATGSVLGSRGVSLELGSRKSWVQGNTPSATLHGPISLRPEPPKTVPIAGEQVLDVRACGDIPTQPQHAFLLMSYWDVNPDDSWIGIWFVSPPWCLAYFCLDVFSLCCGSMSLEKKLPYLLCFVGHHESHATSCPRIWKYSVALLMVR